MKLLRGIDFVRAYLKGKSQGYYQKIVTAISVIVRCPFIVNNEYS